MSQMNDEASIRSKIKNLIAIRNNNKALNNSSDIKFVYAQENEYPLAYLRFCDEEIILVVLNPSSNECSFPCEYVAKDIVYSFGQSATLDGSVCTIAPKSAAFIKLEK